ncbi:hypothetical protein EYF80_051146 [Liparis tanakae]|uniref:HAT C-terminal dimerisation domain-containing protein n=1 Tax=Liparis tanakae TaxID=230148 RepID=A0A4Z2FD40_9TELE|nr:hypothetical protein EYF80_051146 [Liparis tanakae]
MDCGGPPLESPIVQEANRVNKMFQMENTNPCRLFHKLITFYLSLLRRVTTISTVVVDSSSNTAVERTFSEMNLIKTKLRNRMKDSLLENILRILAFMQRHGICCHQFEPTREMLALFSTDMYDKDQVGEGSQSVQTKDIGNCK